MPSKDQFSRIDSIEIHNLSKKYGENFAVRDLNLEIIGGELLILIGGSGSGKTTTLRMINRLIEPDEGMVRINGEDTKEMDPVLLRRHIGYVIQQIGLFPHLTIEENIGIIPRLEGWDKEAIKRRVKELLEMVDLLPETFSGRYPRELSGGQQQRVGLARALSMDPPLLLMDEPFGALDPILRAQLQEEFLSIKEDIGRTILFVTHDINEAFRLGDRIAIMHEGMLVQVGRPEELILSPADEKVARLVDSERKFKHIDNLRVSDLMAPLSECNIYEGSVDVQTALERMMDEDCGVAIVTEDEQLVGVVNRRVAFSRRNDSVPLSDIASLPLLFSPRDPVTGALREMKEKDVKFALVMDEGRPFGMILSEEVLMRLI